MSASLVGSEMCIRDRFLPLQRPHSQVPPGHCASSSSGRARPSWAANRACLLYTSDAADDM
eukprot:5386872-Alexandrium_andersonii.AAC.1